MQQEISSLDGRLTKIDQNLNDLDNKIVDTEFDLNKEIKVLAQRAKAMYKEERHHTSLQIILESKSIYDLITLLDFFGRIMKQDLRLIRESKTNRSKLVELKNSFISKRQKTVSLKQAKQQAVDEYKTLKLRLQKRLKVANKQQIAQANRGVYTADFYNKYLASKQSPMIGLGPTLVAAGYQYRINPDLVIAISGVESTFGRYNANAFNAWGRKAKGGGYAGFASWEDSVVNQTQYLRTEYYDKGLTTLVGIGSKYAPGNGRWPAKVNFFLQDIQAFRVSNQ